MSIKTKVVRDEKKIRSQNKVVKNYAAQLKSKVISDGHRKAVLKEMQRELTAEQFRQLQKHIYKHNTIRSYDANVEYNDDHEQETEPLLNLIQTGGQAALSVKTKVGKEYIKSQKSTGYIHTAQLRFTGDAKKVADESKAAEQRYNDELRKQRISMIISAEDKKHRRVEKITPDTVKVNESKNRTLREEDDLRKDEAEAPVIGDIRFLEEKTTSPPDAEYMSVDEITEDTSDDKNVNTEDITEGIDEKTEAVGYTVLCPEIIHERTYDYTSEYPEKEVIYTESEIKNDTGFVLSEHENNNPIKSDFVIPIDDNRKDKENSHVEIKHSNIPVEADNETPTFENYNGDTLVKNFEAFDQDTEIDYDDLTDDDFSVSGHIVENTVEKDRAVIRSSRGKSGKKSSRELKNQKLTAAKADADGSVAIEAVQTVESAVSAAVHTGGMIKTAIGGTGKAANKVATAVKTGHIFSRRSSLKDLGEIATAVAGGVANAAKDTGQQLIKTKIDKSIVTDTGTETIKQGLTEIRYVDNARKAVLNTARTTVKAGTALKNMPRDTKAQIERAKARTKKARENARKIRKRSKQAAEKTVEVVKKIISSPFGRILLLLLSFIFLLFFLIASMVTVICGLVNNLFGWAGDSSEGGSRQNTSEVIEGYVNYAGSYIDSVKDNIHSIVDEFDCGTRDFPPYEEISELNKFGNKVLNDIDSNEVIAILATLRYGDAGSDASEMSFTDEEIADVIDHFYDFNYNYTHCNCDGCKQGRSRSGRIYTYCDTYHLCLNGEVVNYTLDEVLDSYSFTEQDKQIFNTYLSQIRVLTGG